MKKRLIVFFGLTGVFFLLPEIARADNCSFFADCFNTAKAAVAAATAMGIIAAILSAAADLTPGVGEVKAGVQVVTGYDPITGKRVSRWESAVGLIPVFGRVAARGLRYGMAARRAQGAMQTAKGLRIAAKGLQKGIDVYETARKPYDTAKTVRDAAKDVAEQIQDFIGQPKPVQSRSERATASGEEAIEDSKAIPFDTFADMVTDGFRSVPDDVPASVAENTLISLAKTFGKNGEVLKHIAKAKDTIGDLPNDATIKDVVGKLKG